MQLLHIDSSVLGANSASRALSAEIVEAEKRRTPKLTIVYRDLAAEPLWHLSSAHLAAAQAGVSEPAPALKHDLIQGQAAMEEFLASDIVVIGAPMYNFSVPSQLKSWIDRLSVAGKTFRYVEGKAPEGMCAGKRVIIVSTRGGIYSPGSPAAFMDHQEAYLRDVFGFFGITDVTFVRAEGLARTGQREPAMRAAKDKIAAMA